MCKLQAKAGLRKTYEKRLRSLHNELKKTVKGPHIQLIRGSKNSSDAETSWLWLADRLPLPFEDDGYRTRA